MTSMLSNLEQSLQHSSSPVNNINIYNSTSSEHLLVSKKGSSISTQTESLAPNCETCNKKTQNSTDLRNHTADTYSQRAVSAVKKCDVCDYECNSADELTEHVKALHTTETNFHCVSCDVVYLSENKLENHLLLEHNQDKISEKCDFCERSFATAFHLLEHTESDHLNEYLNCTFCKYKCKTRTLLKHYTEANHNSSNDTNPLPASQLSVRPALSAVDTSQSNTPPTSSTTSRTTSAQPSAAAEKTYD